VVNSSVVAGEEFIIGQTGEPFRTPSAIPVGSDYFVVWKTAFKPGKTIYGQFVTDSGTLRGPAFPIYLDADPESSPKLGSIGDQALVVWAARTQILGIRVDPSGTVLDVKPRVLASGFTAVSPPSISPARAKWNCHGWERRRKIIKSNLPRCFPSPGRIGATHFARRMEFLSRRFLLHNSAAAAFSESLSFHNRIGRRMFAFLIRRAGTTNFLFQFAVALNERDSIPLDPPAEGRHEFETPR